MAKFIQVLKYHQYTYLDTAIFVRNNVYRIKTPLHCTDDARTAEIVALFAVALLSYGDDFYKILNAKYFRVLYHAKNKNTGNLLVNCSDIAALQYCVYFT